MNGFNIYGAVGLSAVAVLATLDSALGFGGGAFLADICRTILEEEGASGGMGAMSMEVKPVPLIGLSLAVTLIAISILTLEQRRVAAGRSAPDNEERAAILSASVLISAAQGSGARNEIADVFKIVTGHPLEAELADLAYARLQGLKGATLDAYRSAPVERPIARRRALAAALMVGCVARPATQRATDLIERLSIDIGATQEDIAAARRALTDWKSGCEPVKGVSLVALLRHRTLTLRPV